MTRKPATSVLSASVVMILALVAFGAAAGFSAVIAASRPGPASLLPGIAFEENLGQAEQPSAFLLRTGSELISLEERGFSVYLASELAAAPVRFRFEGARGTVRPRGEGSTQGMTHALLGDDPGKWRQGIRRYDSVIYRRWLPDTDVRFRVTGRTMAFDFLLAAGADPSAIAWSVEGAGSLTVRDDGSLAVSGPTGQFSLQRPVVFQETSSGRELVDGEFILLSDSRVGIRLGSYNRSAPLVIDPTLDFSTVMGGSSIDRVNVVRVTNSGIFLAGTTRSWNFPTLNPIQAFNAGVSQSRDDAFVVKLTPDGKSLVFATYLGGGEAEAGLAMEVASGGEVWVGGWTRSANFPTVQPYQAELKTAGKEDGFVSKLRADGRALLFSTYLGGDDVDDIRSLALDSQGAAYVTGRTYSSNFPTRQAWRSTFGDKANPFMRGDAFLTKFPASGGTPAFSTYIGGEENDLGYAVTVDSSGSAIVVGSTGSPNFPVVSALYGQLRGASDGFITKFRADGSSPLFSTFFGGSFTETIYAVAVDAQRNIYVAGESGSSSGFPLKDPFQEKFAGPYTDAFVAKLPASGASLTFSTYLGGDSTDETARAIAVDGQGNVLVAGTVTLVSNYESEGTLPIHRSGGFPLADPLQGRMAGYSAGSGDFARFFATDGFISRFSPDGARLLFSSYLGGSQEDNIRSIAVSSDGSQLYLAGETASADFPSTVSEVTRGGGIEGFVARIGTAPSPGGMLGTPGGPAWTRHILSDTNDNGRPDSEDQPIYLTREGPQLQLSWPILKEVNQLGTLELSNPHPVTGRYQTLTAEFRAITPGSTGASAAGASPATFNAEETWTRFIGNVESYDQYLRPEVLSATIERLSSKGTSDKFSAVLQALDTNGDGVYDKGHVESESISIQSKGLLVELGVKLLNLFPSALSVDVPFERFDVTGDGKDDYITIDWTNVPSTLLSLGLTQDYTRKIFVPLADTDGDGIPDSGAADMNHDGVPDADLAIGAPLAGPAPQVRHPLYFAQFGDGVVAGTQIRSQILLYNLDPAGAASARITLRDAQGRLMTVPINGSNFAGEATRTVPAGGLLSLRTDGGNTLKVGSVTVSSDRPLAGVILFDGTLGVCGVGTSAPNDGGFVAPIERNTTTGINTGIAVMNLGEDPAVVAAELLDLQGKVLARSGFELSAFGQLPRFVNEFAWDTPVNLNNFSGLLRVSSNQRLAATALQTRSDEIATLPVGPNFVPFTFNPALTIPAVAESRLQRNKRLVFAHFGDGAGGGYTLQSQILLANLDPNRTASVRLQARQGNGSPFPVDLNGQAVEGVLDFTVSPGGLQVLKTDGLGNLAAGSVVVDSDQLLAGVVLFGGTAGLAGVGAGGNLPNGFLAPVETVSNRGINSGIAITSLSDQQVNLTIRLLGQDGRQVSRATAGAKTRLPAQGHQALFVNELTWNPAVNFSNFIGLLEVRADGPVAGTVLRQERGRLATMPVTPLGL